MSDAQRIVGFDRVVRFAWLDATAHMMAEGLTPSAISTRLDELLVGVVGGTGPHSAKGKTKTVLRRVWVRVPPALQPLRDEGLNQLAQQDRDGRLALHWGMCIATHPFVRDVALTVGRLLEIQGHFSLPQLARRVVEAWGERTTVARALPRVVWSFVEWGVVRETDERLVFAAPEKTSLNGRRELGVWLIEACLSSGNSQMDSLHRLLTGPVIFPFTLNLSTRDLQASGRLDLFRQGLDEDLVLVRH